MLVCGGGGAGTSEGEDGISPKASLTATEKWDAYREALYASDAELLRPSNYVEYVTRRVKHV